MDGSIHYWSGDIKLMNRPQNWLQKAPCAQRGCVPGTGRQEPGEVKLL